MSIGLTPLKGRRLDEIFFLTNKHSSEKCQYAYFIEHNHLHHEPWQQLSIFKQVLHMQIFVRHTNQTEMQTYRSTKFYMHQHFSCWTIYNHHIHNFCRTYTSLVIPLLLRVSFGNPYQHYLKERVNTRVKMSVTLIDISYRIQNMERNFKSCNYTLVRVLIMMWQ